jgi:uncharacterized protein (DUF433 family)
MTLRVQAQSPPIEADQDGVMRVGKTRITLDTIIYDFNEGHTAEEIVSHYPALKLADIYAVISFYLNNQTSVNDYLQQQEVETEEIWRVRESSPDYQLFRQRLIARQNTLDSPSS